MKFKKGDKVLVYGYAERDPNDSLRLERDWPYAYYRGAEATVCREVLDDELTVKFKNSRHMAEVHPM